MNMFLAQLFLRPQPHPSPIRRYQIKSNVAGRDLLLFFARSNLEDQFKHILVVSRYALLAVLIKGSEDKTEALVNALSHTRATCAVVVHGDLTHAEASNIGREHQRSKHAGNVSC